MTDEERKLTISDPISPEILAEFKQLSEARSILASQLLDIDLTRIKLLAAAKKLVDQNARLFEAMLIERGLSPNTPAEIDPKTGLLTVTSE